MFFKRKRQKMQSKMIEQNFKYLDDSLIPGEEIVSKLVSKVPHGKFERDVVAITNKRLVIIKVDKASKPHVIALRFQNILEVNHNFGSFKDVGITFVTNQRQIPTGVFASEDCKKFLDTLEEIRL